MALRQPPSPGLNKVELLTANNIDDILNSSTNLAARLAAWQASKESGLAWKAGLLNLRNKTKDGKWVGEPKSPPVCLALASH